MLIAAACGPGPSTGDTSSGDASSGGASSGDAPPSWPPPQCDPAVSPFVDGACLEGLAAGCAVYGDEAGCAAAPVAAFDGYLVRCAWATLTTIDDPQTCAIASVGGRCVATVDGECLLPCKADPTTNEIIEVCGGPLGASSAVGAEPDASGPCSTQQTIPPSPDLCACAPASCFEG